MIGIWWWSGGGGKDGKGERRLRVGVEALIGKAGCTEKVRPMGATDDRPGVQAVGGAFCPMR